MRRQAWALLGLTLMVSLAATSCAVNDRRYPTSKDFPKTMMDRFAFQAGGNHPWTLSALHTPREAPWKVVVITGTPSWSEYWAPTLAALPPKFTMVVADRPGFAKSEPQTVVGQISDQADALAPMLAHAPGQKVILVGQSYGAPIASLIAARHPGSVQALILMSAFYGDRGATAKKLTGLGGWIGPVLPRDLKNSLAEVNGQAPQLPAARAALASLSIPVIVLHGDADTFVPIRAAETLAATASPGAPATFIKVPGGDHFLNACCVPALLSAINTAVSLADRPKASLSR